VITVVSTASAQGFKTYGKRFMESFLTYWPTEGIRFLFYVESYVLNAEVEMDNVLVDQILARVEVHDLIEAKWLTRFKRDHARNPHANGSGGYRWDGIRFAHKVAAILAADQLCTDDHLLWLDADIVTHNPVDETAIKSWLPDPAWLSWLDRDKSVIGWPECGFLLFNRNHKLHRMAMMTMYDAYSSGRVLGLPETHDSYVWKWLVENLSMPVRDLSGPGFKTMHPLINSPLGHWFDHLKGSRKLVGHSYPSDLYVPRHEDYWEKIL
jgi:hypothetical protein